MRALLSKAAHQKANFKIEFPEAKI